MCLILFHPSPGLTTHLHYALEQGVAEKRVAGPSQTAPPLLASGLRGPPPRSEQSDYVLGGWFDSAPNEAGGAERGGTGKLGRAVCEVSRDTTTTAGLAMVPGMSSKLSARSDPNFLPAADQTADKVALAYYVPLTSIPLVTRLGSVCLP